MSIPDVTEAAAAVAGAVIAAGAWKVGRGAALSNAHLADIERRREHREMFPHVEITVERDPGATTRQLVVFLKGPDVLDHLDSFRVEIRDDGQDRSSRSAGSNVSQEEIERQIWGPYRLRPSAGGADEWGRQSNPRPLTVGERWIWYLEKTPAPTWMTDPNSWEQQYAGKPIRLTLYCEREGFDPWILRREIPRPDNRPRLSQI
jgi:hypothetical protein